jgi:hypothetical protein
MPLTEKGSEIMGNMKEQYGEKKGEGVFYASKNAGKIKGVDQLGSVASFAAREIGETAGSEAFQAATGGGSSGSALRTATTFISPEAPVPTESQAQENAGLGRPANAGPFGAVPGDKEPGMPSFSGVNRPSGLSTGIKPSSMPLLDRLPKGVSMADIKAGSRR